MPEGVVQRLIDDAAWQALKSSSAFSNIEFDTMLALSKVYKLQEEGGQVNCEIDYGDSCLEGIFGKEQFGKYAFITKERI